MSFAPIVRAAEKRGTPARVEDAGVREFLAFALADEVYALPLSCVREIQRVPEITHVPRAPREVLGVVSVRGKVTTVLDLRRKLALPEPALGPRARVLFVDQGDEILGLVVDRVFQVYRLREAEVELATALGAQSSACVMGVGRPARREHAHDILILLDPIALLKRQGHV